MFRDGRDGGEWKKLLRLGRRRGWVEGVWTVKVLNDVMGLIPRHLIIAFDQ